MASNAKKPKPRAHHRVPDSPQTYKGIPKHNEIVDKGWSKRQVVKVERVKDDFGGTTIYVHWKNLLPKWGIENPNPRVWRSRLKLWWAWVNKQHP